MLIRAMLDKMDEGADLVIASRYCEQSRITGLSLFRLCLSWGARYAYALRWNLAGVRDYTCNFRAYRGATMRAFLCKTGPAPYLLQQGFACAGELLRGTAAQAAITVEVPMILRYDNKFEESNMRVMKTIWNTLSMLVRRS
jgi:dolichol-phosphate mannosyltransferase